MFTTNADGEILIEGLRIGKYRVSEVLNEKSANYPMSFSLGISAVPVFYCLFSVFCWIFHSFILLFALSFFNLVNYSSIVLRYIEFPCNLTIIG